MPIGFPIPNDVGRLVAKNENFGLAFDRFHQFLPDHTGKCNWTPKVTIGFRGRDNKAINKEVKERWWVAITDSASECYAPGAPATRAHAAAISRRDAFHSATTTISRLKLAARLAIGLGAANVLENGISLHRVLGFPVIAGSSVKGCVRHLVFCQIAEWLGLPALESPKRDSPWSQLATFLLAQPDAKQKDKGGKQWLNQLGELEAVRQHRESIGFDRKRVKVDRLLERRRNFQMLFGSTHQKGRVVFWDAYPMFLSDQKGPIVEVDLVNPHYGKYYGGSMPPADDENPVISNFLTVRAGTEFQFLLTCPDPKLLAEADTLLRRAVHEVGLGAKTFANYGWFQ